MGIASASPDPLLFLLQVSDSALPIGSYSHSWGLETAVQAGRLRCLEDVQRYLEGLFHLSLLPQEAQACRLGFHSRRDPGCWLWVNTYLSACRWPQETHQASLQLGKRLAVWGEKHWGIPLPAGEEMHHSPVFGWLGAHAGVEEGACVQAYLWSTVQALVTAAVKLVPLGQSEGQHLLCQFQPLIVVGVQEVMQQPPDQLWSFAPLQERDARQHQDLYSRLFQS
ncbi:MAG: urease accessory UreF family protein [Thermostichales cyanobacterium BF4_bins_65]